MELSETGRSSERSFHEAHEKPKAVWASLPRVHSSGVWSCGGGVVGRGTQDGGGRASFTARQDLLISRTNSDVLGLEHICKIEWKHL